MKSVYEVTQLSGVTRRTLQYYDEIGLLKPDGVKPSGYRLYGERGLLRLWKILFYRELGFPLEEIKNLLDDTPGLEHTLMQKHRQSMIEKQANLAQIVQNVDRISEGNFEESMLTVFDKRALERAKQQYIEESTRRLEEGDPYYDFFRPLIQYRLTSAAGILSMIRNIGSASNLNWDAMRLAGESIGALFVKAMPEGHDSKQALAAVGTLTGYIERHFFSCDDNALEQLSRLYVKEAAFVDQTQPGLAQFVADAMLYYSSLE